MNKLESWSTCALVAILFILYVNAETYTTKWDNIDVDEILNSDRLLNNYVNCLKDVGKCTPDGSELKRLIPDALETKCAKCTDKQKEVTKKVINFLIANKPAVWDELKTRFDPDGHWTEIYKDEAAKEGVQIK